MLHAMRGSNAYWYVIDVSYYRALELDGVLDVLECNLSRILVSQSLPSSLVLLWTARATLSWKYFCWLGSVVSVASLSVTSLETLFKGIFLRISSIPLASASLFTSTGQFICILIYRVIQYYKGGYPLGKLEKIEFESDHRRVRNNVFRVWCYSV